MRVRERKSTSMATNKWTVSGSPPSDYSSILPSGTEVFHDSTDGGANVEKGCYHKTVVVSAPTVTRTGRAPWAPSYIVTNVLDARWASHSVAPYNIREPWGDMLKCLIADASGQIPNSGLFTSLAELSQIKGLAKNGYATIKRLLSRKGTTKDLADAHLIYSFGLKPLVKDIESILHLVRVVQKRLNALQYRNGKTVTLSQRRVVPISGSRSLPDPLPDSRYPGTFTYPTTENFGLDTSGTCTFVLSCKCSSKLKHDTELTAQILVAKYLGLTSPLTTAWNLVPLSFVVDWFISVEDRIANFEREYSNMAKGLMKDIRLSEPIYSSRSELTSISKLIWNTVRDGSPMGMSGPYSGSKHQIIEYSRHIGWPGVALAPSGFTLNQFLLSISLIEQRRKR